MYLQETNTACEDSFIDKYQIEFRETTGKNLEQVIIERMVKKRKIPVTMVLQVCNSAVPGYESTPDITIVKQGSSRLFWEYRQVFSKVCFDMGYDIRDFCKTINIDRTTTYHYLKCMNDILYKGLNYDLVSEKYFTIINKIKELHETPAQYNCQSSSDTQSALSALFNPGQGTTIMLN